MSRASAGSESRFVLRRPAVQLWIFVVVGGSSACFLTTSLDGLSGSPATVSADASDAGENDAGDDGRPSDAGVDVAYASCAAAQAARVNAPDGVYLLERGEGAAPLAAYCDMTSDDGGWMLVTPDMIEKEVAVHVTVTRRSDSRGGLVLRAYANSPGCGAADGAAVDDSRHVVFISNVPAWTRIRARHAFAGGTTCWWIFGAVNPLHPDQPNLVTFDPKVDTIRDEVRMGGGGAADAGSTFDGLPFRCDNAPENFWNAARGPFERSAVVILRRDVPGPAGLAVGTSCSSVSAGTTSPTWWEYRDIYVR